MSLDDVIFKQPSLGKDGKSFVKYKLKTMRDSALSYESLVQQQGIDSFGKIKNDPRITPVGKFLRKYWLDELPQLYNLLKGDIKLVGVRPRPENSWSIFPLEHKQACLEVKPGLFGVPYAMKNPSFEEMVAIERQYVTDYQTAPLRTDIKYFAKITSGILFKKVRSA